MAWYVKNSSIQKIEIDDAVFTLRKIPAREAVAFQSFLLKDIFPQAIPIIKQLIASGTTDKNKFDLALMLGKMDNQELSSMFISAVKNLDSKTLLGIIHTFFTYISAEIAGAQFDNCADKNFDTIFQGHDAEVRQLLWEAIKFNFNFFSPEQISAIA